MSERPRQLPAILACRSALNLGFLIKCERHYRYIPDRKVFGDRLFHAAIVNQLVETGEAIKVGDKVFGASYLVEAQRRINARKAKASTSASTADNPNLRADS